MARPKPDEKFMKFLAKKYTTHYADEQDLLQILRIKNWLLKDKPKKRDILKTVAKEWYKEQKKRPMYISWDKVKYRIDSRGETWI